MNADRFDVKGPALTSGGLVQVAREAIAAGVHGRAFEPPADACAPRPLFVSLHDANGDLRGCVGHLDPIAETLSAQVALTAVLAATADPRFNRVVPEELDQLEVEVDVLGPTEPVADRRTLDPDRYGVVVTSGGKRGVLLPQIEGVQTADQQIAIALRKAGIGPAEPYALERFEVERHR